MSAQEALGALSSGCERVLSEEELLAKLKTNRPLRVKLGFDPSAPDLHLGHWVVLRKIRQFQDLGHTAVIVIGDYTARIGDPTGRSKTRPPLEPEQIQANAATYTDQVFRVLIREQTEIRFNSEWFDRFSYADVLKLNAQITVAQLLMRDDFAKRYAEGASITLTEFQYPLMQGYDSVMLRSDVELGGQDQLFNNLVGRDLQRLHGQEPQVVFALPILVGLDGVKKMSKSLNNYVAFNDAPDEMFGKVMSIADDVMVGWRRALFGMETPAELHPMQAKKELASQIVGSFHGAEAGPASQARWEAQFSQRQVPDDIPERRFDPGAKMVAVLKEAGLAPSASEARRLIKQGAVTLDGEKLLDEHATFPRPGIVKCGKRSYLRLSA